jgi:hypothetical protein
LFFLTSSLDGGKSAKPTYQVENPYIESDTKLYKIDETVERKAHSIISKYKNRTLKIPESIDYERSVKPEKSLTLIIPRVTIEPTLQSETKRYKNQYSQSMTNKSLVIRGLVGSRRRSGTALL